MPAVKKHPSVRARTNRASTSAALGDRGSVVVRQLPAIREWNALTVEWWAALWSAPMSAEYHSSDWYQLIPLAIAYDRLISDPLLTAGAFKNLSEEVRAHRQPFGTTPYDRRRLEWTIEQAEESKERGTQRRQRQGAVQPKAGADPRSILHAV